MNSFNWLGQGQQGGGVMPQQQPGNLTNQAQASHGYAGLANNQNLNAYNQQLGQGLGQGMGQSQQQAGMGQWTAPPPQFEENIPEDELEFEGKLSRWPSYNLHGAYPPRRTNHGIDCCQRMLML